MIAVITYDKPHRKTHDLVCKLLLSGFKKIHLVAIPWIERKGFIPIFSHRPSKTVNVDTETFSINFGITFTKVETENLSDYFAANAFDHILIGGAGILPQDLAEKHKVINAHPGYLPYVKGLDALKWSVFEGHPIGVTTHYISPEADEGELIDKKIIPVYFEDTFHSVAYRVYETEIEMLVEAIEKIDRNEAPLTSLKDSSYQAHRRMSHHFEIMMMDKFEEMRKRSNSLIG